MTSEKQEIVTGSIPSASLECTQMGHRATNPLWEPLDNQSTLQLPLFSWKWLQTSVLILHKNSGLEIKLWWMHSRGPRWWNPLGTPHFREEEEESAKHLEKRSEVREVPREVGRELNVSRAKCHPENSSRSQGTTPSTLELIISPTLLPPRSVSLTLAFALSCRLLCPSTCWTSKHGSPTGTFKYTSPKLNWRSSQSPHHCQPVTPPIYTTSVSDISIQARVWTLWIPPHFPHPVTHPVCQLDLQIISYNYYYSYPCCLLLPYLLAYSFCFTTILPIFFFCLFQIQPHTDTQ